LLGLPAAFACGGKTQSDEQVAAMLAAEAAAAAPRAPTSHSAQPDAAAGKLNPRLLRRFKPVRDAIAADENPMTAAKVELGRMLYFDARLSKNHDVSCNTCHVLDRYGVDGERTSPGHKGQRGLRNSPTVYNAAGHFAQFWDGRAATVEEQAKGPITNPIEMAMSDGQAVERTLRSIPEYVARFQSAFPGERQPVSYDNVGKAIGAFERGLVTPSRWDAYLKGDETALSAQELDGLKVFTNVGCMVCHTGEFLGGSMFEKAGVVEEWGNQNDQGRLAVTKLPADRMMFKVPSLRNIEKTAPYFHDGSAATLDEAVMMMGRHQLGLELTDEERSAIVSWFRSLTGELPKAYIQAPQLPPSTPQTPAPNPA
jgi:cytochrome c peroxidase